MSTEITNQVFDRVRLTDTETRIHDVSARGCTFLQCKIAQYRDPTIGATVRRVSLADTTMAGCLAHGVYFDEITISRLRTRGGLDLHACVFRHVTLTGRIGRLLTQPPDVGLEKPVGAAFEAGIIAAYRDIDWALDISGADFDDASFYYVPGDLIRRDPTTQFLLRRERFADVAREDIPEYATAFVDRFKITPFDSMVAIASKHSKYFERRLTALQDLKDMGLAE